jgi:hypothetical protein
MSLANKEFQYLSTKTCACCNTRLDTVKKPNLRHVNTEELMKDLNDARNTILSNKRKNITQSVVKKGDIVCKSCIQSAKRFKKSYNREFDCEPQPSASVPDTSVSVSTQTNEFEIKINIPRTIKITEKCFICNNKKNLCDVPNEAYFDTFINRNILISKNSKCCKSHLKSNNTFNRRDINKIESVCDYTLLKDYEFTVLLDNIRHASNMNIFDKFRDLPNVSEYECKSFTNLSKDNFLSMLHDLKSINNSPNRSKSQALMTYLFRLKSGFGYKAISDIFSIDDFQNITNYCTQVRESLLQHFVPKNLGVNHLTRDEWTQQNTVISNELFNVNPNELVLIADGTYIFGNKSSDNSLQKKMYSVQKSRHLTKPFVVCTTNGKIVDIYGLFTASTNDSKILQELLDSNRDLKKLLHKNDHLILDRGFRDIIPTLNNKYKLQTHMPTCVPPSQKQLTVLEANQSRFVTKNRWVIEVINGKLKTLFKQNNKVHQTSELPHVIDDMRVSAAILNKFYGTYSSDKGSELIISTNMKAKLNTPNALESIIETNHLDKKRVVYEKMTVDSIPAFPKIDTKSIINNITMGSYQLRQAKSYINDNFNDTGRYNIELFNDKTNLLDVNTYLLRTRIQSRHVNSTKYNSYIAYSTTNNNYTDIKSWYCTCKSGKRTVGCCSHISSVIYYLSNARYTTGSVKRFTIGSIFPECPVIDSSDSDVTIVDSDNTDDEYEPTHQINTLYPDLSTLSTIND